MKFTALLGIAGICALAPFGAFADDAADYQRLMTEGCPKEIASYCKDVKTGDARLLACLYAREDKLSGPCISAVMVSAERLKTAIVALSDVQRVCANDAAKFCPDIAPGKGHLIQCLTIAQKRVSAKCNAAIDGAFLRP